MNQLFEEPRVAATRGGLAACRVCGCTETDPCFPPCAWVAKPSEGFGADGEWSGAADDICTTCQTAIDNLLEWAGQARRANTTALLREFRTRTIAKHGGGL